MSLFGGNTNASQNSRLLGYRVQTSISSTPIKIVFGVNRIPGNVIWTGDWKANSASGKAGKGKYGGNYTYTMAAIAALCSGPILSVVAVWTNQLQNGATTTSWLNAESLSDLGLTVATGALGQAPWTYLTTNHPDQALGYSQIAYVAKPDWDLGSAGTMPNFSYEVAGFDVYPGTSDTLCSQVIYRLLTDSDIGAGFDPTEVDVTECELYCLANSIFISPVLDQQKSAAEWIGEMLLIANCEAVWSEGVLKIRSRGDVAATGNGATFAPNITPVMDLTDDDFKDREEPVRILRPNPRDAYNSVSVNWTNRGNQYNTEPVQEQDQAMIDAYGYRPASPLDALGVCRADVAAQVVHTALKKNIYNRTQYKFKLGYEHILLEPMDVVTLTCTVAGVNYQKLDHTPVRLLSIAEDTDGYLDCTAEEMPAGAGTPIQHPKQTGGSFATPLNADPGMVNTPVFYEGSREMRQALYGTPYALLMALSGGPYWGGCSVWRSYDGTTYEVVARQVGRTPMGILTAGVASGADPDTGTTVSVDLLQSFGVLQTVTQADADNFKTLFVLGGGATSELLSYETATLTTKYGYDLTYLRRGIYGSVIQTHATNDLFFLVSNACNWIYPSQDVHKTIHFKFTSFNQYGKAEQALADVTDYTYTLTGGLSGVKVVTTNYTVEPSDVGVNSDTTGGNNTITLPTATDTVNTVVTITNIGSGTTTISGGGGGVATTTLTQPWQSITLQSTPSGWIEISGTPPRFVDDETPTGAIDGTSTTYTLVRTPSPSTSLDLYRNEAWQSQGLDYTLSGNTITITGIGALAVGEFLRASYRW
jgi:Putative phage tail protein